MILGGCTTEVDWIVPRGGFRHPPIRKSGERQRRAERLKKSRVDYVTINGGA